MAISLSQNIGARSASSVISMPFGSANAGGSLLTLEARTDQAFSAVAGVEDSAGNTWARAVVSSGGTAFDASVDLWYAENSIGSTNRIFITNVSTNITLQCNAQEWSGCSTANALAASTRHLVPLASTHTGGTIDVTVSTAVAILGHGFTTSFDISAGPVGYTALISTFAAMRAYYRIFTSTGQDTPETVTVANENTANVLALFIGGALAIPTASLRRRSLPLLGAS